MDGHVGLGDGVLEVEAKEGQRRALCDGASDLELPYTPDELT